MSVERIAFAFGRFNGPTCEHEKLFNAVIDHLSPRKFIFVSGPLEVDQTTAKDPLTLNEKAELVRMCLAPNHRFVYEAATRYTRTPNQALSYVYIEELFDYVSGLPYERTELTIFGGDGNQGVKGKAQGGSIEQYQHIVERLNFTKYPERVENGHKLGGDYRMAYDKVDYVGIPRGIVSGSALRAAIYATTGLTKDKRLEALKPMFHSRMTEPMIEQVARVMNDRREMHGIK